MRSLPTLVAAAAASLILTAGATSALAEREVTNPVTGQVVILKFAKTPSSRELTKAGQKLGKKTLESLLAACAPPQIEKLSGCLSGGK